MTKPSSTTYYNFYSTGEEVLAEHKGTPRIFDIEIFGETGRYSWGLQEKLKGRLPFGIMLGSNYGGWGVNLDDPEYYTVVDDVIDPIPPDQANLIDPAQLRTRPFFKKGSQDDDLFDEATGSIHAEDNRTRLLAEAFPARTLAAGRDEVSKFEQNNINMQTEFQNGWPRERKDREEWLHSDIREVAYLYVHPLFKRFVNQGGLGQ